jgi:hypothetical protein
MKALVHMPQQSDYEQRGFFAGTPERLTAALLLVLENLGWDNLDVCGFGVTAQMSETNVSPVNCLTAILTCIPHGSDETELLLTVCTHQGVWSSKEKAVLILTEVSRYVDAHNHEGIQPEDNTA